jgi:hypothetical protein
LFFWFSSPLFLFFTQFFFWVLCFNALAMHRQTRLVYDNSFNMLCFIFLFIGFLYATCSSTFLCCYLFLLRQHFSFFSIWIGSFLLWQFLYLATRLSCVVVATLTIVAFFHFPSPPPPCISFLQFNFCRSRCLHFFFNIFFCFMCVGFYVFFFFINFYASVYVVKNFNCILHLQFYNVKYFF